MALLADEIVKIQETLKNSKFEICNNPKVSIIVPAYNTEKFIAKCLFSLINQTLKEIEIIVVNDGSSDDTLKVVSLFAQHDLRIKVINQENLKQGAARNNGTKIATGEYIGFIDSDDWVDLDYFEKLYNSAKKYNSDMALATNVRVGNGKTKKRLNIEKEEVKTVLQDKFDICNLHKDACPTNKLYKLDFIKANNIIWPEGVYCEDKLFVTQAVYYANSIVSVPEINYYYYRRPDSTVKSKHSNKKYNDRDEARRQVLKFLKEKNANIRDKDFWAVKRDYKIFGINWYQIKESLNCERHLLFALIQIREVQV